MNVSPRGLALIEHFESCKLEAYPDPHTGGAPWTIGWGHTRDVQPGDACTQEQADAWLAEDVGEFEDMLIARTIQNYTSGQFDALVSFLYNVGPGKVGVKDGLFELKSGPPRASSLLKYIRIQEWDRAADEFLKWVNPGSAVERGLRRRRVAERAQFLGEDWEYALAQHIKAGG